MLVAMGGAGGLQKSWCGSCQHTTAASTQQLKIKQGAVAVVLMANGGGEEDGGGVGSGGVAVVSQRNDRVPPGSR